MTADKINRLILLSVLVVLTGPWCCPLAICHRGALRTRRQTAESPLLLLPEVDTNTTEPTTSVTLPPIISEITESTVPENHTSTEALTTETEGIEEVGDSEESTELNEIEETTESTTAGMMLMKGTEMPIHACVIDVDESEPEFQRYVCTGNRIVSLISTTFLLTMILFAVIKNISAWGFVNLVDIRKAGVSFPQRPELIVLLCSTLPTIFTTIARPLFFPYQPMYAQFISELRCMQARQFFDLFSRTSAIYHMIYWAFRMPLIRLLWRNYLRYKAFRAIWTKEHIIEVLHDKFAPDKEDKFRKMFGNNPEYMVYYAQFLQSGLPMQYLQTIMKPGNLSPSMSTTGLDGMMGPNHLGKMGGSEGGGVLPRVNLGQLMAAGSDDNTSPKVGLHPNLLAALGSASSFSRPSTNQLLRPSSLSNPLSRNTSFRSSNYGGRPHGSPEGGFGLHLTPEDAALMALDRQPTGSREFLPSFSSQEMLFPGMLPGMEFRGPSEKKAKAEEILVKPPTREFVYICKHGLPGLIYILSFFVTMPSIFGFDMYQTESPITTAYFYYDFVFLILIPMLAVIAAFYYGVLAKTQLNGETKMRFRMKCYYVNFVILNLPILFLMVCAITSRITLSREVDLQMYGTGIIIALTAYHAQFVLKTTVYTTGCNCICCSESCLVHFPRLNRVIICMVTPRIPQMITVSKKSDEEEENAEEIAMDEGRLEKKAVKDATVITQQDPFGRGTEIQIHPQENGAPNGRVETEEAEEDTREIEMRFR